MPPRILILCDYYLPGYKAGGTLRTVANLVELLGDDYEFHLATRDCDFTETEPYPDVEADTWKAWGKARVIHLSRAGRRPAALLRRIRQTPHDLLYVNSFLSPCFTVVPLLARRFGWIPRKPLVLAPEGELAPPALAIKPWRKRLYLALVRALGLARGLVWRASSEFEEAQIRRWFGARARVSVAPNPPGLVTEASGAPARSKQAGRLRAVYLSRLTPIKNLVGALEALRGVEGEVVFDIYGPLEDADYWARCERVITTLPPNVKATNRGPVAPERVIDTLAGYELFFLTTETESYGHVIQEALLAGTPVLVSDRTPWRNLAEAGVGWDLPLEQPQGFTRQLQRCVEMGEEEHGPLRERARRYGRERSQADAVAAKYHALFERALAG